MDSRGLDDLVQAIPTAALLLGDAELLAANDAARRLLGSGDCPEALNAIAELLATSQLARRLVASSDQRATIASLDGELVQAVASASQVEWNGTRVSIVVLTAVGSRESRDAHRSHRALDVCRVGVYEHDYIEGEFYGSALFRSMYGFTSDQPITLEDFGRAFHPLDKERVIAEILASRDPSGDGVFDTLIRILRPDGEVRWLQSRAQTEFGEIDGERRALVCTGSVIDVTERVTLAKALERSEERYATALEASRIGIFDHDHLATDDASGFYWSPTLRAICGMSPSTQPSLDLLLSRIHPVDLPAVRDAFARAQDPTSGGDLAVEYRFALPSGSTNDEVRWLTTTARVYFGDVEGARRPIRTIGAVLDVTESKQRELERERASAVLDATPDLVTVMDRAGRLVYVNRAARRFAQLDDSAVAGWTLESVHSVEAARTIQEEGIPTAMRDGTWRADIDSIDAEGLRHPMSQLVVAHRGASGEVEHLSSIARDLSREKDLERRFLQAQKMEAIGRLAGGIAHDFNNILSVITGCASLAAHRLPEESRAQGELKEVLEAADRAAQLTAQLLAFSTKQILQPRVFGVNDTLQQLQPMVTRMLDESIRLELSLCSDATFVRADPVQLEQVLINLAVNARDAMPRGGALRIATRVRASSADGPGWVCTSVEDTGHGMDAETQKSIFEPFFTTKERGKGTGLGLATVFGIVRQSGGDIHVHSTPGRGTTFEIELPRATEAPTASAPRSNPPSTSRAAVILLAEDDDAVRNMAVICLREAGHRVLDASGAERALELARDHAADIDLLLTDVVMPGMNGKELSIRFAELAPRARVLFTSGYTEDAIVCRGVLDRNVHFLPKPFTPKALLQAVQATLGDDAPQSVDTGAQRGTRQVG